MRLVKLGINLFEDTMLVVLAGDLLYLYYAGAWTDPIAAVLISELVFLWGFIALGVWRIITHVKEVKDVPGMAEGRLRGDVD